MDVQPYVWVSLKQKYLSSLAMLTKSFEGNVILNSDFTIQNRGDMYPLKMTHRLWEIWRWIFFNTNSITALEEFIVL